VPLQRNLQQDACLSDLWFWFANGLLPANWEELAEPEIEIQLAEHATHFRLCIIGLDIAEVPTEAELIKEYWRRL
jgi:hypothetical protein